MAMECCGADLFSAGSGFWLLNTIGSGSDSRLNMFSSLEEKNKLSYWVLQSSVADPERFDANPDADPTFQADSDPDPNIF